MAFIKSQSRSLIDRAMSPMLVQRRTYMTSRQIFLLDLEKALMALIDTSIGCSRGPARSNSVIVSLRD